MIEVREKFEENQLFFFNFFVDYAHFYYKILQRMSYDAHTFFRKIKDKKQRPMYHLILTFRNNKIFVNINDRLKRNYFFLSTGLFIKFFEKKKLFRKSKIIRTILIKYLRKLFLLANLPRVVLLIKKNPIFFVDFLNLFNQQIPYKFNEPLTNREILDDESTLYVTKFLYFIFLNTEDFTRNKTKKRGRVKRKISRKIVSRNTVVD
jgi:hypothetical protein